TGPRPGDADDYDRHDNRGDQPSKGHEQATEEDPEEIEDERHRLAVTSPCWRRPSPVRSDRRLYGFRCWLNLSPPSRSSAILDDPGRKDGGPMNRRREAALRARLRALEAARRLGNKDDERTHLQSIRRLVGRRH